MKVMSQMFKLKEILKVLDYYNNKKLIIKKKTKLDSQIIDFWIKLVEISFIRL